jgi:hypothetical protein
MKLCFWNNELKKSILYKSNYTKFRISVEWIKYFCALRITNMQLFVLLLFVRSNKRGLSVYRSLNLHNSLSVRWSVWRLGSHRSMPFVNFSILYICCSFYTSVMINFSFLSPSVCLFFFMFFPVISTLFLSVLPPKYFSRAIQFFWTQLPYESVQWRVLVNMLMKLVSSIFTKCSGLPLGCSRFRSTFFIWSKGLVRK